MSNEERIKKANQYTLEYHTNIMSVTDDEHNIVTNKSAEGHNKRMEVMTRLGDFEGKSLFDVGCGLGAFYDFLKKRNVNVDYWGCDINDLMIQRAKKKYPAIADRFSTFDIVTGIPEQKYDYIVMSGLLNLDFGNDTNLVMIEKLFQQGHKYSNIGYAISMTSALTKKIGTDCYYYDPQAVLGIASKLCNNFRFDHSYMPHDFTVFCYKDDFYTK